MTINFLHYFQPDPILLQLGPLTIRWYGFFIALAFLVGLIVVLYLAKSRDIKSEVVCDLAICVALGGIIGARFYDVFINNWGYYSQDLWAILRIWEGGMAIYGALIGGGLFLFFCALRHKISFFILADMVAVALPLGQAIGRWGNYFNNELFGAPTKWAIGIPVELVNRPLEYINFTYFHPVFLYESILNFIFFFVLLFLFKKGNLIVGSTAALYVMGYALIRIAMEFIRVDPVLIVDGLRLPQVVAMAMFLLASLFIVYRGRKTDFSEN